MGVISIVNEIYKPTYNWGGTTLWGPGTRGKVLRKLGCDTLEELRFVMKSETHGQYSIEFN